MAKQVDPKIAEILRAHGETKDVAWDCHGTWVVKHAALERIAAKVGIQYSEPKILVAQPDAAAILVTGTLGDKTEWSIGEAAPKNNKNAYPFAMAEKRAKDRVILKLIGLHGLAYSEEEADDFKSSTKEVLEIDDAKELFFKQIADTIDQAKDGTILLTWWNSDEQKQARKDFGLSQTEADHYKSEVVKKRDALRPEKPVKDFKPSKQYLSDNEDNRWK